MKHHQLSYLKSSNHQWTRCSKNEKNQRMKRSFLPLPTILNFSVFLPSLTNPRKQWRNIQKWQTSFLTSYGCIPAAIKSEENAHLAKLPVQLHQRSNLLSWKMQRRWFPNLPLCPSFQRSEIIHHRRKDN